MTTRYCLTIEYVGENYYGWQRQPNLPTIQQEVEGAIGKFSGQTVEVQSAGRTDAGVHAKAQKAHVDLQDSKRPMTPNEIAKAINAHLRPQPISVIDAQIVSDDFHARFSAKNKLYVYRILNRQSCPAIEHGRLWHIKKALNITAMQDAAKTLLGQHDFSSFRDAQCQAKNPVRTLDTLTLLSNPYDQSGGKEITIEAQAQSFLHHMVRNIVGTLVQVGQDKRTAKDVQAILEAKDRTRAGPTAPAHGLYLERIDYD